ncbi:MAG: hypothetical protein RLY20_1001 [Verrucomicrobiota bacterium]|jgi:hypothetical protein
MRRAFIPLLVFCSMLLGRSALASSGEVIKVLPHFLDAKGKHTLSPSLYDRDAYQAMLRKNPEKRSGIRYDVNWRARGTDGEVKLRIELRGIAQGNQPRTKTIDAVVKPGRGTSRWDGVALTGEGFKSFGEVTAWRVTLWEGDKQLGEQKSFLW